MIIKTLEDKLSIFQGLHNQINILKLNLTKNKKWWFLDGEEHGEFESTLKNFVLVLAASPESKKFEKTSCTLCYMPWPCCWDRKNLAVFKEITPTKSDEEYMISMELMDMWVNCYKEIPFQTCKERFDVVGPMPRKVD